jgi:hypothetical protein
MEGDFAGDITKGRKMNGSTDHLTAILFLPGHSSAEGLLELHFDRQDGIPIVLKIPPLEVGPFLQPLIEALESADIEFPKAQQG